jgi:3-mercaptopyruvate sulfurtransferase SseA
MTERVREFSRTALTAAIIVALAAATSLAHNALRTKQLPLLRPSGPSENGGGDPSMLNLARAKELYDQGVVFVDARDDEEFNEGHIRGARHIEYEHAERQWEAAMRGVDPGSPVVVYCNGEGCNSSQLVADALRNVGFQKVFVFFGGWPAWSAAGYPLDGKPSAVNLYEFKK